tara:strand:- start:490 stop:711 length:222 start_codon:yes stop_codon:yes gene_type:complete
MSVKQSWRKDILRPIFGTVLIQPLMLLWAYYTDVSYITNLGPLTIITTIYLIPVYRWYEKIADSAKFDEPKWM